MSGGEMPGQGTLVNVLAIVVAGLLGLGFGQLLNPHLRRLLIIACGMSTICLGLGGTVSGLMMPTGDSGQNVTLMLVGSLTLGAMTGGILGIERGILRLGEILKQRFSREGDAHFISAFVTASLTVSIGAMAIVGAIADGLNGDCTILYMKSVLDAIIIFIMTASLGRGCIFAALPVGVLQGTCTLAAAALSPLFGAAVIANVSLVGAVLIVMVGTNITFHTRLPVADFLPSLVVAGLWILW